MSLGEMVRRVWHKFERFAYAMDDDPRTDLERRVAELEQRQRETSAAHRGAATDLDSPTGQ